MEESVYLGCGSAATLKKQSGKLWRGTKLAADDILQEGGLGSG